MTPEQFARCLADLKSAGRIRDGHGAHTDLANALGVSRDTIYRFELDGTKSIATDLALAGLLAGLPPYGVAK